MQTTSSSPVLTPEARRLEGFISRPGPLTGAILSLLAFNVILYHKGLSLSLVQDDYFFLHIVMNFPLDTFVGYLKLLAVRGRPVTQEFYFAINQLIFGLNPFGYHLSNMIVHLCNVILCFCLVSRLAESRAAGFLGALFFSTRVGQTSPIYHVCLVSQSGTCLFFFLTFLLHLQYKRARKPLWLVASSISFVALARSNLNGLMFPFCITLYEVCRARDFNPKKLIPKIAKEQWPYYLLLLLLFKYSIAIFQAPETAPFYKTSIGVHVLKNVMYYMITLFNMSYLYFEVLFTHVLIVGILAALLTAAVLLLLRSHVIRFFKENPETVRVLGFGAAFYFLNLAPFIFFEKYAKLDYNIIPSLGMALILGYVVTRFWPRLYSLFLFVIPVLAVAAVVKLTNVERREGIIYKSEIVEKVVDLIEAEDAGDERIRTVIVENATPLVRVSTSEHRGYEVEFGRPLEVKFFAGSSPYVTTAETLVIQAAEPNFYVKH
jgi:hypothetical protein